MSETSRDYDILKIADLDPTPTHVSTKHVRTFEITGVDDLAEERIRIKLPDREVYLEVPYTLDRGNGPYVGDRLIVYRDNYVSWCPAAVYERDYRHIAEGVVPIARTCHAVNSAICAEFGHDVPPPWDDAADWQRESAVRGVLFALMNPDATAEQQHEAWCEMKRTEGWTWGATKDPEAKQHPCLIDYAELPPDQRVKDSTFRAIVAEMAPLGLTTASAKRLPIVFDDPEHLEELCVTAIKALGDHLDGDIGMIANAVTNIRQGFMWLERAIAPTAPLPSTPAA